MEYEEAKKKVQSIKTADNYFVIEMDYGTKAVLPYKDGLQFLAAMNNAELLKDPYKEKHSIGPWDRNKFKTSIMSRHEYEQFKIAALLRVSVEELKEYAEAA